MGGAAEPAAHLELGVCAGGTSAAGVLPSECVQHGEQVHDVNSIITLARLQVVGLEGAHGEVTAEAIQDAEQVENVDGSVVVRIAVQAWRIDANIGDALNLPLDIAGPFSMVRSRCRARGEEFASLTPAHQDGASWAVCQANRPRTEA